MSANFDNRIKQLEKGDLLKSGPVINTNISDAEWERSRSMLAKILNEKGRQECPEWPENDLPLANVLEIIIGQ